MVEQNVPAKFGEETSVMADGLCFGCLGLWRENSPETPTLCAALSRLSCFMLLLRDSRVNTPSHSFAGCVREGGSRLRGAPSGGAVKKLVNEKKLPCIAAVPRGKMK